MAVVPIICHGRDVQTWLRDNLRGQSLGDHNQIGDGSYSKVYALNVQGQPRVIKVDDRTMPWVDQRILDEIGVHAKVQAAGGHRHVLSMLSHMVDISSKQSPIVYWIFPAGAQDLNSFLKHQALNVEADVASKLASQVCSGLAFLHKLGIAHRDLKPANCIVFIDLQNICVRLADFGLARSCTEADRGNRTTGLCTQWYRAPEWTGAAEAYLLEGKGVFSGDVWSLGCMLFELSASTRAFPCRSVDSLSLSLACRQESPEMENEIIRGPNFPSLSRSLKFTACMFVCVCTHVRCTAFFLSSNSSNPKENTK